MESRRSSAEDDGSCTTSHASPPLLRRASMEEDLYYQRIMTNPRRPPHPPPYQQESSTLASHQASHLRKGKQLAIGEGGGHGVAHACTVGHTEQLPDYKSSIFLEGVFDKKHEVENVIKRAQDRQWHPVYVALMGTALNIYNVKKPWGGWGKTRDGGPSVDPDNPPWMKKGKLDKSYSLLYADVGIAADYKKRRYAIRVRAETDQFLLACVELSTFIKWLEALFAAIDIALPLEDRDFPRDMSIPRIQRIRWFRGQSPTAMSLDLAEPDMSELPQEVSAVPNEPGLQRPPATAVPEPQTRVEREPDIDIEEEGEQISEPPPRIDPIRRLSTTSYANMDIDPIDGKWLPDHRWSSAHDMLYAKLCYSNLLFRSPRKSNYVISEGEKWYVDWATGRTIRVLPPAYGKMNYFGAWQTVHTENRRI